MGEGNGGGTDEQVGDIVEAGILGGTAGKRVLHHAERCVSVSKLGAELRDVGHVEPAVVGNEQRLRLTKLVGERRDDCCLLFLVHGVPRGSTGTLRVRRFETCSTRKPRVRGAACELRRRAPNCSAMQGIGGGASFSFTASAGVGTDPIF